ncbi:hypothetical protein D9M72_327780 [compost metagenome]
MFTLRILSGSWQRAPLLSTRGRSISETATVIFRERSLLTETFSSGGWTLPAPTGSRSLTTPHGGSWSAMKAQLQSRCTHPATAGTDACYRPYRRFPSLGSVAQIVPRNKLPASGVGRADDHRASRGSSSSSGWSSAPLEARAAGSSGGLELAVPPVFTGPGLVASSLLPHGGQCPQGIDQALDGPGRGFGE